ncbi:MAG: hypothetical protein GPJ51_11270 [Candidatus Heimdallarchaeota archaeon]|nr:hypothetical protein [Candidatus Heimdallarchaeota archaeon]
MIKYSKQSKISIRKFLCVSILIVGIITFSSMRVNSTTDSYDPKSYTSYIPHDYINISYDGAFEVFPGTGTEGDPYIIEGYEIIPTSSVYGITVTGTTKYFVIRNCYIDAEFRGINIDVIAAGTATIINNTIYDSGIGIYLYYAYNSTVTNNTCTDNSSGMVFEYSPGSTATNNTCNDGSSGIKIISSTNSIVVNNTCSSNSFKGIYLELSDGSTITNNNCSNNGWEGIYLEDTDDCIITYNLLKENGNYGVYLLPDAYDSYNNRIHHNNFVDNNLGGTSQASDDCSYNFWYDTMTNEGNYWNDWVSGTYAIDGSAGAIDLYPLGDPVVAEYNSPSLFTLLILVVPLFLTMTISRRRKIA